MAINFDDPAQTMHNLEPIPINTQAKYDAGLRIMQALYTFAEVPWSTTAETAYEQRVRNGQTLREIIANTYDEYLDRTTNVPGVEA